MRRMTRRRRTTKAGMGNAWWTLADVEFQGVFVFISHYCHHDLKVLSLLDLFHGKPCVTWSIFLIASPLVPVNLATIELPSSLSEPQEPCEVLAEPKGRNKLLSTKAHYL